MTAIDDALKANESFAKDFRLADVNTKPAKRLAVVACMDARMNIESILGLRPGDAHIVRNAGGVVTDDVTRSLIVSQQLLGTDEVVIVNHTDCGMMKFRDEELNEEMASKTGIALGETMRFYSFEDVHDNVRNQIRQLRAHPWIPESVSIRGFVYDVKTGLLDEVLETGEARKVA